jgi:AcrR family transcriptional regulator
MDSNGTSATGRVERKKEETTQKIIQAALALFKQRGFDATTMEQIAQEADIARGTLYNYFPVKEAILNIYIQRSFSRQNSERAVRLQEMPDTRSRMRFIFQALMEGVQAQKEIFEKYMVYRMQKTLSLRPEEDMKSGLYRLGTEIIELGQKSGELRSDLSPAMLEDLFEFAFIEMVKLFYLYPETYDPYETIERCMDLFMNGAHGKENKS